MLEFALWPLWRLIKGPISNALKERFGVFGGQFKATLSSTIDDLIRALTSEFFNTDTWQHTAKGELRQRKDDNWRPRLTVQIFPLDALKTSERIRVALSKSLLENRRLGAQRRELQISDDEWQSIAAEFSAKTLDYGLPYAFRRMIRQNIPLYLDYYVIDLTEREAIRVNGIEGFHTVVVLYSKPSLFLSDDIPTISQARRIWKARNDEKYDYKLSDYDGFKAT